MTAGNAAGDYPSCALDNGDQARQDFSTHGFALKQRNAPKTLGRVPEEGQPRGPTVIGLLAVVLGEYASDHVLIDVQSKRFICLLRDTWATKSE